jgi:hypothetical protein
VNTTQPSQISVANSKKISQAKHHINFCTVVVQYNEYFFKGNRWRGLTSDFTSLDGVKRTRGDPHRRYSLRVVGFWWPCRAQAGHWGVLRDPSPLLSSRLVAAVSLLFARCPLNLSSASYSLSPSALAGSRSINQSSESPIVQEGHSGTESSPCLLAKDSSVRISTVPPSSSVHTSSTLLVCYHSTVFLSPIRWPWLGTDWIGDDCFYSGLCTRANVTSWSFDAPLLPLPSHRRLAWPLPGLCAVSLGHWARAERELAFPSIPWLFTRVVTSWAQRFALLYITLVLFRVENCDFCKILPLWPLILVTGVGQLV